MSDPTAEDALRILTEITGKQVSSLRRFPNGLAHFVYDGTLSDGQRLVIRLTRPAQRNDFAGAVYWSERLRPLGVPLPAIIRAEIDETVHGFPVLVMERLPGTDLGDCYTRLTHDEKRRIARRVVDIQRRASELPAANGYGYAHTPDDPALLPTWRDVLDASVQRSREWTRSAGVMGEEAIDRVEAEVSRFGDYFARVRPICFLHDTTTKNVLVHEGNLSGIVDVDSVCYGDPLWLLSLICMALRSMGADLVYIDAWTTEIGLTEEQQRVLALYTALHCVTFMGEIGQRFNQDTPLPVSLRRVADLQDILGDLLRQVAEHSG